jgi:hypothetical protein
VRPVADLRPETLQVASLPENPVSRTATAALPQADVNPSGITFSPTRQWFNDIYKNWGQPRGAQDNYNNYGDVTPSASDQGGDQRQQRLNAARAIAENPAASVSDKLKAFTSLYNDLPKDANGRARITLKDGGQDREFTIERPKVGNVNLTQVFAKDDQGKDHVVLRAVERGEGRFERQRDRSGNNVEYVGRWWTQNQSNSTVSRTSDGAAPVVPPDRRRQPEGDPVVPPEGRRRRDPVVPPEGNPPRRDPVVPPEGNPPRRDPVVPPEGGQRRRDPVAPPDEGRRHRPRPPQEGDNGGRTFNGRTAVGAQPVLPAPADQLRLRTLQPGNGKSAPHGISAFGF